MSLRLCEWSRRGWHDDAVSDPDPAGPAQPSGELIVQRTDDTMGVLLPLKISVDGAGAAGLLPNQAVGLRLAPGTHLVRAWRSRVLAVDVTASATVHVSAGHPPMPSYWRLVLRPFSSTRPTLAVTSGAAAVPGPGEPTAAAVWLEGWIQSFVRFNVWLTIAFGCFLVIAGAALAALGGATPMVVMGALVVVVGLAVAGAGAWLRHRVVPVKHPAA